MDILPIQLRNRGLFFKIEKLKTDGYDIDLEKLIGCTVDLKIKAALIWQPRKSICVLEPDDSAWK